MRMPFHSLIRWCRCAQPPATGSDPAGIKMAIRPPGLARTASAPEHGIRPASPPLADAGGIPSCSRWLSAATPPDQRPPQPAPRQGCQPPARMPSTDQPPLPPGFRHEKPRSDPDQSMAERPARVPRRHRQWFGRALRKGSAAWPTMSICSSPSNRPIASPISCGN